MKKDLIGDKIGSLIITDKKRKNNRLYYYCKCDCGNSKWIRADSLTKKNRTESCGCYATKTQFQAKDISNCRFGKLIVLEATNTKCSNGSKLWRCKCDCGTIAFVSENNLVQGNTKSCGCLNTDARLKNRQKAFETHLEKNIIDNTNISIISRKNPMKHNTSGVTGVRWDSSRKKWIAEITFKNRRYYLGRFDNKLDAINVRKEAEESKFKDFLQTIYKKK